ncbi:hypothetical protein H4R19_002309 [Coemansia spiralis]|nr:hypothetical protein H4R19_002309 [Coemansia spiralis]
MSTSTFSLSSGSHGGESAESGEESRRRAPHSYHHGERAAAVPKHQPPRSLPNVKLASGLTNGTMAIRSRQAYSGLYAVSYSSDSDGGADVTDAVAMVVCAPSGLPRRAQPRAGAARLAGMVRPRPTAPAPQEPLPPPSPPPAIPSPPPSLPTGLSDPDYAFLELDNVVDRAAVALPRRLKRASHDEPRALVAAPLLATEMLAEDELNGLMAPGARGDEKQRARTDGGPLGRLLYMVNVGRREREAKLFRPVLLRPGQPRASGEMPWLLDAAAGGSGDDEPERMFPFCCCAPSYCVAATFVAVLVLALAGFFVWPRVPSVSISALRALAPASVVYDVERNQYGLHMPVRLTYEIHSGNFYPLRIRAAHVRGFDGVTGNRILATNITNFDVAPLRLQFHSATAIIDYLTSDPADPALADLFVKCAPRAAGVGSRAVGRPGAMTVRFQISVDMANLGWLHRPVVTLNQRIECPE